MDRTIHTSGVITEAVVLLSYQHFINNDDDSEP